MDEFPSSQPSTGTAAMDVPPPLPVSAPEAVPLHGIASDPASAVLPPFPGEPFPAGRVAAEIESVPAAAVDGVRRVPSAGEAGDGYGPIRGVTVGYETGAMAAREDDLTRVARRGAVRGQALAAMLFVVALLPPIILCLLYGLSHRADQIPYASLWAWGAGVIALLLTARVTAVAIMRPGARSGLTVPLASVICFLLIPSAVVLYMELAAGRTTFEMGVTGMVLYAVAAIALLMVSLTLAPLEQEAA